MSGARPGPLIAYWRLAALAIAAAMILAAAGWWPTQRWMPPGGLSAMAVGIGTALLSSLVGAAPIAMSRDPAPSARLVAMMLSMCIRMGLTLAAFAAAVLVAKFEPRGALALWTGVGYLVLLAVETTAVVRWSKGSVSA